MKNSAATFLGFLFGIGPVLAMAQSGDRWTVADGAASAVIPSAVTSDRITSSSLSCEAQRWILRLDLAPGTDVVDAVGVLDIDGRRFDIDLLVSGGGLDVRMPPEALDPLREGIRLTLDLAGALEVALGDPVFSLRGSRVAIDTVAERCTLRDMRDYTPVTFTPYSSYLTLARQLRKSDIEAFVSSTASEPTLDAAMAEFGDNRRVLFTRVCGSSWYYGSSGCNITGYAPSSDQIGWKEVYDTENVHLYTDPREATDGWADIATLPVGSGGLPRLWRWNSDRYDFVGELPDETEPLALRSTVD